MNCIRNEQPVIERKADQLTMKIPVLVIDDDDFMLEIIKEAADKMDLSDLIRNQQEVLCCDFLIFNNEKDFENAITDETHIAIVDHKLGGLHDGLDVIETFEKKRKTKIPSQIIIISGQTSEEVMIRYINEKKVHAYIKKPEGKKNTVERFQQEIIKHTKTAIDQTIDFIKLLYAMEKLK